MVFYESELESAEKIRRLVRKLDDPLTSAEGTAVLLSIIYEATILARQLIRYGRNGEAA